MNRLDPHHQVRLGDARQIFSPEQLQPGEPIANVLVLKGTTLRERIAKTGFSFALAALAEQTEESAFNAAKRGWNHHDLEGAVPRWRGRVEWRNNEGVMVELTGQSPDPDNWAELVGTDPAELPDIVEPMRQFNSYSSLGLSAVCGRWEFAATLRLDQ